MQSAAIVEDKRLAFCICEFNYLPIRYIHPSWLGTVGRGKLLSKLRSCRRIERRLSRYLLTEFELEGDYWFEFSDSIKRIALLEPDQLARLVLYAGLTVNANTVQGTILGKEVLKLKRNIGEDAYSFALKGTSLFGTASGGAVMEGYSKCVVAQAKICGMRILATAFPEGTPALTKRMLLKLPVTWCNHFLTIDLSSSETDALMNQLKRVLAKLERP